MHGKSGATLPNDATVAGRGIWLRRKGKHRDTSTDIRVAAVGTTVPANLELLSPTTKVLVIEDLCVELTRQSWLARRPPRWRPIAYRAWRAERLALDAKQQRLRTLWAHR